MLAEASLGWGSQGSALGEGRSQLKGRAAGEASYQGGHIPVGHSTGQTQPEPRYH